ncbi:MAG: hypothetical protein JNL82_01620 [Myxococcales bacterium]|nr:hypothetical protein [Myxococcales bacterium]
MAELRWSYEDLADGLAAGLATAAAELELEQAVHGLDVRRELDLHPLLHAGLRAAGYGVHPEQRFPRERGLRRKTEGSRCDLVVTPEGLPLADEAAQTELFAPRRAVALCDAMWIEVKAVAQFKALAPNRAYASALQRPVWRDVEKLASDPQIAHAAVLLILFTADLTVAAHDLGVWAARASAHALPLWPRVERSLAIGDRVGHRVCTLALWPIERRG